MSLIFLYVFLVDYTKNTFLQNIVHALENIESCSCDSELLLTHTTCDALM